MENATNSKMTADGNMRHVLDIITIMQIYDTYCLSHRRYLYGQGFI